MKLSVQSGLLQSISAAQSGNDEKGNNHANQKNQIRTVRLPSLRGLSCCRRHRSRCLCEVGDVMLTKTIYKKEFNTLLTNVRFSISVPKTFTGWTSTFVMCFAGYNLLSEKYEIGVLCVILSLVLEIADYVRVTHHEG